MDFGKHLWKLLALNPFLLKLQSSNVFPAIFFQKSPKSLFWKIMSWHNIQPIKIRPRFCKLSLLVFAFFVSYLNRNHKDTTHPQERRLDATLYIDQNVSQDCQPAFVENLESVKFFCSKKPGDFSLKRDILKSQKKLDSRLFLYSVSQSS